MLIPDTLRGTPTASLMQQIIDAATARGLFVKREWISARYGGSARYTLLRGSEQIETFDIDGFEGKTLRAKSSAALQEFLTRIEALPVLSEEEKATVRIEGPFLLTDEIRTALHNLGCRFEVGMSSADPKRGWFAPAVRQAEAEAIMLPRRAVKLGRLSRDHEAIVIGNVPHAARMKSEKTYEWLILATYADNVAKAIANHETWVSLGNDFPKTANDELRGCTGARWDSAGCRWIVRKPDQAEALAIIAKHREIDEREQAAAREAKRLAGEKEKAAGIIRWSNGEGYGAEYRVPGSLVYCSSKGTGNPYAAADPRRWYIITECDSTYYREDGLSFGVGDDSGRIYYYVARPATEAEYAEAEAERLAAVERRELVVSVEQAIKTHFRREDGEYVWNKEAADDPKTGQAIRYLSLSVPGEEVRIGKGRDIYGSGEWFLVDADGEHVWHVTNNGMDGDDWSRNNLHTGGAGAIGFRFARTPERMAAIDTARQLWEGKDKS